MFQKMFNKILWIIQKNKLMLKPQKFKGQRC